jgi:hypothetical protein
MGIEKHLSAKTLKGIKDAKGREVKNKKDRVDFLRASSRPSRIKN